MVEESLRVPSIGQRGVSHEGTSPARCAAARPPVNVATQPARTAPDPYTCARVSQRRRLPRVAVYHAGLPNNLYRRDG
jgi:hypothetical protein